MTVSASPFPPESAYAAPILRPRHPLRFENGWVRPHRVVLFDKIGDGIHACTWCGRKIAWRAHYLPVDRVPFAEQPGELTVDHENADTLDNRPENLVPACRRCNSARQRAGNPAVFGLRTPKVLCANRVETVRRKRQEHLMQLLDPSNDFITDLHEPSDSTNDLPQPKHPPPEPTDNGKTIDLERVMCLS